jgi:hypothetical protein
VKVWRKERLLRLNFLEVPKKVAEGVEEGKQQVHFANWESSPQM